MARSIRVRHESGSGAATAGDKSGQRSEKRFYKQLIARADKRFGEHLSGLKKVKER